MMVEWMKIRILAKIFLAIATSYYWSAIHYIFYFNFSLWAA